MINDFYLWQLSELLNVVARVAIQTVADIVTSLTIILRKKEDEGIIYELNYSSPLLLCS